MWQTKYSFLGYLKKSTQMYSYLRPDWVARLGMRVGGAPIKGDTQLQLVRSGAVPLGLVMATYDDAGI